MQSFYEETDRRQEAHHSGGEGPSEPLWLEMQAPSAWPGLLHDPRFFDTSYYPSFSYNSDSTSPVQGAPDGVPYEPQRTPEEASLVAGSSPKAGGTAWLSFVLVVACAGLLLVAGILAVHARLFPPDESADDKFLSGQLRATPRNADGRDMLEPWIVVPQPQSEKGAPEKSSGLVTVDRRYDGVPLAAKCDTADIGAITTAGAMNTKIIDEGLEEDPKALIRRRATSLAETTSARKCQIPSPNNSTWYCGSHQTSFTEQQTRAEFYDNVKRRQCIWTAADAVGVCNRGLNRFRAIESCSASCASGSRISDRCCESTLSCSCSTLQPYSQDGQWFLDCCKWGFPQALPVKHLSCSPAEACSLPQLRHAYFSSVQCVNTSRRTLMKRRRLIGSYQFPALATCHKAHKSPQGLWHFNCAPERLSAEPFDAVERIPSV